MRAPFLFFVSLFFIMLCRTMHAEKPFEFATTPGKLPKEVVPLEYCVRIVPNIDKFTFTGAETIKLSVRSQVRQLALNALELKITDASLDSKALSESAIKIDKKNELLTLVLPSELTTGDHTRALSFAGKFNQQGQGLFYVAYQAQVSGTTKIMLGSRSGPTQLRVIATKGKAKMGRYALEATAQILKYYNDYFGAAYPLPKLDQIALPGGFGGAMENWGGITYFESALLFDPKNSSAETKQNIYEVLAHEMAHQWFGDLVTMAWWDNLWLNEGFASWMGTKCTAHFNPQWEVWLRRNLPRDPTRRVGIAKEQAMEGDARSTTHPIHQRIATEVEANSALDDINY